MKRDLLGLIPATLFSISPEVDTALANLDMVWQVAIKIGVTIVCYLLTMLLKWIFIKIKKKIKQSKDLTEEEKEEILKPVDITKSDLDNKE